MSTFSYTLLKISRNIFKKDFNELTSEQRSEVMDIYYDFY
jgi:hypothetical protein